jgi:hypothetical protein
MGLYQFFHPLNLSTALVMTLAVPYIDAHPCFYYVYQLHLVCRSYKFKSCSARVWWWCLEFDLMVRGFM